MGRRRLAAAILAIGAGTGITAGAAASVADLALPSEADTALIAVCDRALAADDRSIALTEPFCETESDDLELQRRCDAAYATASDIIAADWHPAVKQAAVLPAQTRAGLEAKARLLLRNLNMNNDDDALAISLARDVLAGVA